MRAQCVEVAVGEGCRAARLFASIHPHAQTSCNLEYTPTRTKPYFCLKHVGLMRLAVERGALLVVNYLAQACTCNALFFVI